MKADWCGFGAAQLQREADTALADAQARKDGLGTDTGVEQGRAPGVEVMNEATEQVRRRWVKALVQRRDPRSLAVAEFLGGLDEEPMLARARLQALASTTSDPMVTVLALQRPCDPGLCRNIEASQWSRLEPANLQAWLALLRDANGGARAAQSGYALERMAAEGRYSRNYQRELQAILLSLPQTSTPGLANEAELQFISGAAAAWTIVSHRPLAEACQAAVPGTLARCDAVLDRLWEADSALERAIAIGLARRWVLPAHPELRARWEPRAREYEAASAWSSEATLRLVSGAPAGESPCSLQTEMRKWISGTAQLGEWGHWRAEMLAAGVDEAALSARWRRDRGRGALDPEPARR
ncbi:MAG TPA: hypothetical protein VIN03_04885 [Roseateles sp.]